MLGVGHLEEEGPGLDGEASESGPGGLKPSCTTPIRLLTAPCCGSC